jgi:hypothetical protein
MTYLPTYKYAKNDLIIIHSRHKTDVLKKRSDIQARIMKLNKLINNKRDLLNLQGEILDAYAEIDQITYNMQIELYEDQIRCLRLTLCKNDREILGKTRKLLLIKYEKRAKQ